MEKNRLQAVEKNIQNNSYQPRNEIDFICAENLNNRNSELDINEAKVYKSLALDTINKVIFRRQVAIDENNYDLKYEHNFNKYLQEIDNNPYEDDDKDYYEYDDREQYWLNPNQQLTLTELDEIETEKLLEKHKLPKLPNGYGFKGGAARALLQDVLLHEKSTIRDIDITMFSDFNPDENFADQLSREYMAEDYLNNYGVEQDNLENYFDTRDFTFNEVAAVTVDNKIKLLATERCINDLRDKNIVFTDDELRDYETYGNIKYKLQMKALLFEQIFKKSYGKANFDHSYIEDYIPDFHIALQLNKAFELNNDGIIDGFKESLLNHDFISQSELENTDKLVERLKSNCNFTFGVCYTDYQEKKLERDYNTKYGRESMNAQRFESRRDIKIKANKYKQK